MPLGLLNIKYCVVLDVACANNTESHARAIFLFHLYPKMLDENKKKPGLSDFWQYLRNEKQKNGGHTFLSVIDI